MYDREYPLRRYPDAYDPYQRQQPSQLPPIVVVNSLRDREARKMKEREGDSESESSSSDSDSGSYDDRRGGGGGARPGWAVVRDPELRNEAGGALLLRSSRLDSSPGRRNQPLVL